jgi:hypothetical protein
LALQLLHLLPSQRPGSVCLGSVPLT